MIGVIKQKLRSDIEFFLTSVFPMAPIRIDCLLDCTQTQTKNTLSVQIKSYLSFAFYIVYHALR